MKADQPIFIGPHGLEFEVPAAQFKQLEALAAAITEPGFSPSAEQVANVLLTWALDQLGPDAINKLAADLKASEEAAG